MLVMGTSSIPCAGWQCKGTYSVRKRGRAEESCRSGWYGWAFTRVYVQVQLVDRSVSLIILFLIRAFVEKQLPAARHFRYLIVVLRNLCTHKQRNRKGDYSIIRSDGDVTTQQARQHKITRDDPLSLLH